MVASQVFFIRHFAKESHPFRALALPAKEEVLARQVQEWNAFDRDRIRLNEEGTRHGRALAARLAAYLQAQAAEVRHVFVSPYQRTRESAELLRPAFPDAELTIDERLRELDPGIEFAFPYTEFAPHFPEYRAAVEADNYLKVARPFGESHQERREGDVHSFLADMRSLEGDACAITHAGIIDLVHQVTRGLSDDAVLERFGNPHRTPFGSVLRCRYDSETDSYVADDDPIDLSSEPSA